MQTKLKQIVKSFGSRNHALFALSISFLILVHPLAFQDRLILIMFCLAAVGTAFSLVKRRALGLAAGVITVTGTLMFTQLYFSTVAEQWHPTFDLIRDIVGISTLFCVTLGLLVSTYRVERDERYRQARKAMEEQLVAMRAEALRRTSHEVRTPISTITAISETLLDGSTGSLNESQREFVGDIDEAAKHLMQLVNDILDFAKAEAGMIRLAPEPVAVSELVDQCVKMLDSKAQIAHVAVSAQVATEVNEITADPLRLRQILLNLLSNAIKFTPAGGAVVLRVRPHEKTRVRITVRDTGRGISAAHLPHLFQPYYQATVADQGIGTGLGLAIIKHLTTLHGGTVTVDSVVGAGTVFTIDLPVRAKLPTESSTNDDAIAADNSREPVSSDHLLRI